jgi:hypothetical protein
MYKILRVNYNNNKVKEDNDLRKKSREQKYV